MTLAGVTETCVSCSSHRQVPIRRAWNTRQLCRIQRRCRQWGGAPCTRCHRRFRTCRQALESSEGSGDEPVDIDQLAKRLSQEAEKVRQQQSQDNQTTEPTEGEDLAAELAQTMRDAGAQRPAEVSSPFGYEVSSKIISFAAMPLQPDRGLLYVCLLQNAAREADILAEVGEGGFAAQEFELLEQIGQLSWVRIYHSASHDGC